MVQKAEIRTESWDIIFGLSLKLYNLIWGLPFHIQGEGVHFTYNHYLVYTPQQIIFLSLYDISHCMCVYMGQLMIALFALI